MLCFASVLVRLTENSILLKIVYVCIFAMKKKAVWIFAQNYFKIFRCRLSNFDAWYISRIHTEHFGVSLCKNSQKWVHLEFPVIDIFQYQNRFCLFFISHDHHNVIIGRLWLFTSRIPRIDYSYLKIAFGYGWLI